MYAIPTRYEAEDMLYQGGQNNPGGWYDHSQYVALGAEIIASQHPQLDSNVAYILGLLHDIGRQGGESNMRHTIDGYRFLEPQGYTDSARICLTHSFPIKHVHAHAGQWDCPPEDVEFVAGYLASIEYNEYDRLIQLCDALALPTGFCLFEKRFVDIAVRHGVNEYTVPRWQATFALQQHFEQIIGSSIYELLPGVVDNTFASPVTVTLHAPASEMTPNNGHIDVEKLSLLEPAAAI